MTGTDRDKSEHEAALARFGGVMPVPVKHGARHNGERVRIRAQGMVKRQTVSRRRTDG